MNTSVLVQPSGRMTSKAWEKPRLSAARAIAAPAYPPIRAWEEEVGRPHHQVSTSHTMAPSRPAITTYCVTSSSRIMPLPMVCDGGSEKEGGHKVKKRCPEHGESWGQHPRRNHRRDAVGCIVKPIEKIKKESCDDRDEENHESRVHRQRYLLWFAVLRPGNIQALFRVTASSTLAASSALSVAFSSTSYNSLILIKRIGSLS